MKYSILIISLYLSSCACCGEDVQYENLPPSVQVNTRYLTMPQIEFSGITIPIEPVHIGYTFSEDVKDSATGKKIHISGVVDTAKGSIQLAVVIPKDSIKTSDTVKTQILKEVEKSWVDRLGWKEIIVYSLIIIAVIALLSLIVRLIGR